MTNAPDSIRVVLFDVGGVLVELSGVPVLLGLMNNQMSADELLAMWLKSPAVRSFERGQATPEMFAEQLIKEIELPISDLQFIADFTRWPTGLFPGALELVHRVPAPYVRATLCNTNVLHWPRLMDEMMLADAFDHHFASHLIGKIKPDEDAFHHVMDTLNCEASAILFLDDNRLNVDAAQSLGIRAVQVKGVQGAERALIEAGVF
ncbi:MAG TPA: HAD family phosphatase [Candidatus Angelobacter sp.]|jgi:putative hydrolase of the HAD superfamily|nr:HAD family phosphatase [Candidatus Angelobacter sp.]